jgi:transcriptional regulator with XRE-family HTH domain
MYDQYIQQQFVECDKFGERLRQFRKKLGLVQTEFGDKLGVSLATITRLERGVFKPQGDFLAKLALVFDCDIRWILTGIRQEEQIRDTLRRVIRQPQIYGFLEDKRRDWDEIIQASLRLVDFVSGQEKADIEEKVAGYRQGIEYLDALLSVGSVKK